MNNEFPMKISSPIQGIHLPPAWGWGSGRWLKISEKSLLGKGGSETFIVVGRVYIVEMGSHNFEVKIKTA